MSLRITLFPALIAAAVLGACDKGSGPVVEPKEALVSTPWLTSAHTVSPGVKSKPADQPITDYVQATGDCFPTPEITFQKEGRYAYSDGVSRCPGSDLAKYDDTGNWTLSEDGKTLTLQMDRNMIPVIWKVKSISAASITVEYPMDGTIGGNPPQTEILTLRPK
jgi:hypothetical protein